jgi:hypothetical protein
MSPSDYLLKELAAVRTAELEQTLLILPFTTALSLIPHLAKWLQQKKKVERVCQVRPPPHHTQTHTVLNGPWRFPECAECSLNVP